VRANLPAVFCPGREAAAAFSERYFTSDLSGSTEAARTASALLKQLGVAGVPSLVLRPPAARAPSPPQPAPWLLQ